MLKATKVAVCLSFAAAMTAAQEPDRAANPDRPAVELHEQPTHDPAWGMTFRTPRYTHTQREPTGKYLFQVADDDQNYAIVVMVRPLPGSPTLAKFSERVRQEVDKASTITNLLGDREAEFDGRSAVVNYYQVADPLRSEGYRLLGQAIVQIARSTFIVFELSCTLEQATTGREAFEAMLSSLKFTDPKELEAQRKEAVRLGDGLLARLKPEHLHAALVPDQYFRIVETPEDGRPVDVGWMRMSQLRGEQNGHAGVVIRSASRWQQEGDTLDALEQFFLADDEGLEMWAVAVTRRKPGLESDTAVNRHTFNEVGIRTLAQVQVTVDSPQGTEKYNLTRPGTAYLSRVHAILLPQLLPADLPATYAFYHYHPVQRKIVLRMDQVVPAFTGYSIQTHASLSDAPQTSTFDPQRRPLSLSLSPTRRLIPTTAEDLKKRWPQG